MPTLFLKIAFRYLFKNKLYSFLNILGLALGIASFIIITLYVSYERSYDTFEGSAQVYRVYMDYAEGETFAPGDAQTYNLSGPTLKKEFPEIKEQVRLYRLEKATFINGEKVIEQPNGSLADASYFDVFDYPLIKGNKKAFDKPNTIILNETLAKKLYGDQNPIGKTLSVFYDTEVLVEVVGILKDIPQNTHFKTNFLISFQTMNTWDAMDGQQELNWNQNNFFTYIKINKNADVAALRQKIIASDFEKDPDERHNIEALSDIHLYSDKPYEAEANGSVSRVRFLSAIAIIILVLSWLNYINLSTAKSMERAREIGIRKVAGAQRPQLILQSLTESLLLNTIAIIFAIGLVIVLLPAFNSFVGKSLSLGLSNLGTLFPFLGIILFGTLLSGLYPALVISNFSPVKALKGKVRSSTQSISISKGLITLQFFATIVLIIGTLVVGKQIHFLREQPIGVDLAQVVALKGEVLENQADSVLTQRANVLKGELKKLPFVEGVASSKTYPGDGYDNLSSTVGITYPNGVTNDRLLFYLYGADPDYFGLINLKFLAGKPYSPKNKDNRDIVINETMSKEMGFINAEEIIGKTVKFWGISWVISGVIEDYHHFGLKTKIAPLTIGPYHGYNNVLVKMKANSLAGMDKNIGQLQQKWKEMFPQSTLNYSFLDKKFETQYLEDKKFGSAFQIFTWLAIIIAALGLFGLTSYTCLQRKKEIGIRKVSGASVFQILTLLNKDFMKWIGLAFIIAIPAAWYIMHRWLEEFAYRTSINWWVFAIAGIAAFAIAILSISYQALKAAIANPVKSLRTE